MRPLLILTCLVAVLAGCGEIQQTADSVRNGAESAGKAADCAKIATDMAQLQLDRVTDRQAVDAAAQRLEEKVRAIDDKEVREAAGKLADSASAYATAVARGDTTAIERTSRQVQERARATAESCGIPASVFLG